MPRLPDFYRSAGIDLIDKSERGLAITSCKLTTEYVEIIDANWWAAIKISYRRN